MPRIRNLRVSPDQLRLRLNGRAPAIWAATDGGNGLPPSRVASVARQQLVRQRVLAIARWGGTHRTIT